MNIGSKLVIKHHAAAISFFYVSDVHVFPSYVIDLLHQVNLIPPDVRAKTVRFGYKYDETPYNMQCQGISIHPYHLICKRKCGYSVLHIGQNGRIKNFLSYPQQSDISCIQDGPKHPRTHARMYQI